MRTRVVYFITSLLTVCVLALLFLMVQPADASYCRCAKENGTNCRVETDDPLTKDPLTCVTCSVFCQQNNLNFNSCQEQPTNANQPWNKGGCGMMYCWCQTDKNTCENHTVDANNNLFMTENACQNYCASRNWKAIHYDPSYIDWNQKTVADKGCSDLGGRFSPGTCVCDNGGCQATDPKSGTCPANCKPGNCTIAAGQQNKEAKAAEPAKEVGANDLQVRALQSLNRLPGGITGVPQVIGLVAKTLLGFIGSVTLALYIYAGFLWMTSMGSSEKTEKARTIFLWTSLGVVVMLSSYILVDLLLTSFELK